MGKVPLPDDSSSDVSVGDTSIVGFSHVRTRKSWIGKLGNFSVQYNLAVASIAIQIMTDYRTVDEDHTGIVAHPEPAFSSYTLMGMVFAGSVCGMLGMGYLGDWVGRKRAMLCTLFLVVFGALVCGLGTWGDSNALYGVLCAARFLLGVGVGGIYPLSAARASEGHGEDTKAEDDEEGGSQDSTADEQQHKNMTNNVAWAFFWQTPGAIMPYLLTMLFFWIRQEANGWDDEAGMVNNKTGETNPDHFPVDAQWRILFCLGAVPTLMAMYLNALIPESKEFLEAKKQQKEFSAVELIKKHPARTQLLRALFGTASSWFMYDVSYYGTAIFQPDILKAIWGDSTDIFAVAWQSAAVGALGIPAAVLAIWNSQSYGSYWTQFWGFALMAVSFGLLGLAFALDLAPGYKFGLFLLVSFAINYGPNVTTFTLPAVLFPTEVKGTFHGVSAASAKLGAVAGTFIYKPVQVGTSMQFMMFMQAVLSILGMLVTYLFIPREEKVIDAKGEREALEKKAAPKDHYGGAGDEY